MRRWGHALHLHSATVLQPGDSPRYGDLTLATDAGLADDVTVSWQQYWFKGAWFDNLEVYWHDLITPGAIQEPRLCAWRSGRQQPGAFGGACACAAGADTQVRFVISWNFPNCDNYWKASRPKGFPGLEELLRHAVGRFAGERPICAGRVGSSLCRDQTFQGYALCLDPAPGRAGCHLRQHLHPQVAHCAAPGGWHLLRLGRAAHPDGGLLRRAVAPMSGTMPRRCPSSSPSWNAPCATPTTTTTARRRRHALPHPTAHRLGPVGFPPLCRWAIWRGDEELSRLEDQRRYRVAARDLARRQKASLEFAWSPRNIDQWDRDKTGVLWGRQHHTLDMELFGPNSWLTGLLSGCAQSRGRDGRGTWAKTPRPNTRRSLPGARRGWMPTSLTANITSSASTSRTKAIVEAFARIKCDSGRQHAAMPTGTANMEEIKYQIGEGSSIDQIAGAVARQPLRPGRYLRPGRR